MLAVVGCLVFAGLPLRLRGASERSAKGIGALEVYGPKEELVPLGRARADVALPRQGPALDALIARARNAARAHQGSQYQRLEDAVARMELWLNILDADTPGARHERTPQLPVSVQTSAAPSGQAGRVKTFVVGGRVRARWFVPDLPQRPSTEFMLEQRPDGPAILDDDGSVTGPVWFLSRIIERPLTLLLISHVSV